MSQIDVPLSRGGFGQTERADNWWVQPLVVFLGLSAFIVYSTWAAVKSSVAVNGTFDKWDATLTFASTDSTSGVLDIKIQADSVNTGSGTTKAVPHFCR